MDFWVKKTNNPDFDFLKFYPKEKPYFRRLHVKF